MAPSPQRGAARLLRSQVSRWRIRRRTVDLATNVLAPEPAANARSRLAGVGPFIRNSLPMKSVLLAVAVLPFVASAAEKATDIRAKNAAIKWVNEPKPG